MDSNKTQTTQETADTNVPTHANGSALPKVTNTTTRTDLSLLFRVLRVCIRPLKPKLVAFGDQFPAGSPKVDKRPRKAYGVSITERKLTIPDISINTALDYHPPAELEAKRQKKIGESVKLDHLYVYDFTPAGTQHNSPATHKRDTSGSKLTRIYYFAGGGFQAPASGEHWKMCAKLAKDLHSQNFRVVLVSYPLAPNSPASDSLPLLRRWLAGVALTSSRASQASPIRPSDGGESASSTETKDGHTLPEDVILMGDSAGANVVLSLGLWWAEQIDKSKKDVDQKTPILSSGRQLKAVWSLSAPTDMHNSHPDVMKHSKQDPILTKGLTDDAAKAWTNDDPMLKNDPFCSPNLSKLDKLRESGIVVNGVIGTADTLAPDALLFKDRLTEERVPGEWLVWEGQMHCFPIAVCYGMSEAKEGYAWIKQIMLKQ